MLGIKSGPIGLGWLDTCLVDAFNHYVSFIISI